MQLTWQFPVPAHTIPLCSTASPGTPWQRSGPAARCDPRSPSGTAAGRTA